MRCNCLLYTSDAADERSSVDLGGRRIIKKDDHFVQKKFLALMNKTAIFIPARMGSTRFPGKPLAPIDGIPMIVYCARNALKTGLEVYVCTDSEEIMAVCSLYKIKAIITPHCETGTDRIAIAAKNMGLSYVINLQGCLLYTSPSPRDGLLSRMPSSA